MCGRCVTLAFAGVGLLLVETACFCLLLLAFACFCMLLLALACVCLLLLAFACVRLLLLAVACVCSRLLAFAYFCLLLKNFGVIKTLTFPSTLLNNLLPIFICSEGSTLPVPLRRCRLWMVTKASIDSRRLLAFPMQRLLQGL